MAYANYSDYSHHHNLILCSVNARLQPNNFVFRHPHDFIPITKLWRGMSKYEIIRSNSISLQLRIIFIRNYEGGRKTVISLLRLYVTLNVDSLQPCNMKYSNPTIPPCDYWGWCKFVFGVFGNDLIKCLERWRWRWRWHNTCFLMKSITVSESARNYCS